MSNYLAFIHAGIEHGHTESSGAAVNDGVELAQQCLKQFGQLNTEHFPPRLLILLASPIYLEGRRATQLLEGVHSKFADEGYHDIPLIGSSVAAVFFSGSVYPQGTLLVCLASRLLEVEIASSPITGDMPLTPIKELLRQLDLDSEAGEDPNPFANRALFTFLPGNTSQGYLAADLHECLRERLWARVPIIGGVSSGYDGQRHLPAAQFVNRNVYKNSLVAARITSGTLVGMSSNAEFKSTEDIIRITDLAEDGVTVMGFDYKSIPTVISELREKHSGFMVLGKSTYNDDPFIEYLGNGDRKSVRLLRRAKKGDAFTVLMIEPEELAESVSSSIERSCKSIGLVNPVGCLGFRCSSYLANISDLGMSLRDEISVVEDKLGIPGNYVGGFVDGEAGRDSQGRSLLRSWSTAAVVFGDDLRPRTVVYKGFYEIAEFLSRHPSPTESSEQSVRALLQLLYNLGFPGVRLLLMLEDDSGRSLVVPDPSYTAGTLSPPDGGNLPFQVKLHGKDIIPEQPAALVVRTGEFRFVPYSGSRDPATSHYYAPLRNIRHETTAVLHIDLGKKVRLRMAEQQMLAHLGIIVGASLSRVFSAQENRIRAQLQEALKRYLSDATTEEGVQNYLSAAVKALGLRMGHIRRANLENWKLELYAGIGTYYEASLESRAAIDFGDVSPTTKAYDTGHNVVVNDALNNPNHLMMLDHYREAAPEGGRPFIATLGQVRSYANIYFESKQDNKGATGPDSKRLLPFKGTINLVSEQPWFFKHPQTRVLSKIAEHVEFLLDILERKRAEREAGENAIKARLDAEEARAEAEKAEEREEKARKQEERSNRRLRFSLDISPQLAQQNLDDFRGTLDKILSRYCEHTQAEVGSLYLWDDDRGLYVLRAAYRWKKGDWVDAAAYSKEDGWFGARLRGEPRHLPDLEEYYRVEGYNLPGKDDSRRGGMYSIPMFNQPLNDKFPIEVIGLPLRLGQDKEVGVIALYRRAKRSERSGFLKTVVDVINDVTDRGLIIRATYEVAGLIGALLERQDNRTERDEQERRKQISELLSNHIEQEFEGSDESFEELVCRSVAEEYRAAGADLYSVKAQQDGGGFKVLLKASCPPGPQISRPDPFRPDPHLYRALEEYSSKACGDGIKPDEIYVKRKSLMQEERNDPYKAEAEGLVERVCLPLVRGKELMEVLDLHWDITSRQTYEEETHFRKKYLWQLGEDLSMFGRLHKQTSKRIEAEKSQKMFMGKVGAVAQLAHTWKPRIAALLKEDSDSKQLEDPRQRELYTESVLAHLRAFRSEVDGLLSLTKETIVQPRPVPVLSLLGVEERPDDVCVIVSKRRDGREIKCDLKVPPDLKIRVTANLMRFAFENIIDNAIVAMQSEPDSSFEISAIPVGANRVRVRFVNYGNRIDAIRRDAINHNDFEKLEFSWGLIIAKCFALCHGGDMTIETPIEGGTASNFILPKA